MKVIIAGSRGVTDYDILLFAINECLFSITEVVSGGARGADTLGERYAKENNIPLKRFIPKWNNPDGTFNKAAGIHRNKSMAQYADALLALWDGKSKGTQHMIEFMNKIGKPGYVLQVKND